MRAIVGSAILACLASPGLAEGHEYDLDCKVILCLAGGFPSGCKDAFSYMLDRITPPNPKAPFGFCSMSSGGEYDGYETYFQRVSTRTKAGWDCPDGNHLYFEPGERDSNGRISPRTFCYDSVDHQLVWKGGQYDRKTVYYGQSPAVPINYRLRLTIEPGTDSEFESPTYYGNYRGYVRSDDPLATD